MLLSRAAIDDVLQQLEPRDFYRPAHADVFAAIVDLHHRGDPADAVTVGHELDSRGQLARVGGLPYLHTLIASVSTPASAAFHAEIVAAQARKRRAIEELTLALQRVRQAGTGFDDVDDLVADAAAKLAAGSTLRDRPATSWAAVDLTAVLDGTYRPAQPTVSRRADGVGLFYPGRVHSVSAESEAGKSWFALLAARIELDRGHSVVYLDFEDDEGGVVGRLLALGADPDAIRHGFAYVRPMEAINVGRNRAILADLLEHFDPTLVVLDGVTEAMTLHGMELIDNGDIARFGAMLPRWIADRGPAVVDLDHVTKDREGRGRYSIGGQHKLAGLNGAAYVLENRTPFGIGVTGRSTVYVAKDRPAQLRQHALPARDGLHWFADLTLESVVVDGRPVLDASLVSPHHRGEELSTFRPTALMAKVAAALAGAPRPLSKTEITDRVRGRRAADTRAALAALVDEGFVVEEDGPRGAKNHRLVKPFEESAA
ncbi:hypothetical protein GCM10010472_52190 [Pseudonocardia halophobica]|uniref:DNA helicase DnaB-like N-terminal domain-containing protein n=2 Tax=Pseudonocardia halophobica TaxID=29401 RepID=A0A9W6L1Z2_9PSEU|nr:hypothetical protein GCM10017577_24960 [Pseudonocardia halophobica]